MLKKFLDALGSPFVYKSPTHEELYAKSLRQYPNWYLRRMAGTTHTYNKATLIKLILLNTINTKEKV